MKEISWIQVILYAFSIFGIFAFSIVILEGRGYTPALVDYRTHSMDNSLGFGFGLYKNYKHPFYEYITIGTYLSGNNSAIETNYTKIKEDIEVGDIIIFYRYGNHVIHQVIDKKEDWIITQGTNNLYNDGRIYYEDIIGKLVFWIKFS